MRAKLSGNMICILTILALTISPGISQAEEPGRYDKGTVFSFHLNEGKGKDVTDASGNENHGILGGGELPDWVEGPEERFGTALEFFGCNHVEIPMSPELDTEDEITFETWININSLTASWSTIYSKNSQSNSMGFHWIYINQNGSLSYQYANGTAYVALSATIDWEFGNWLHLAITHKIDGDDGGIVKYYVNGEQIHEAEHTDKAFQVIGGKASLGTYQSMIAPDRYALDGMLDEVRLSPWVKTDAEISESMRALAVKFEEKLVDMWGRIKTH
jgi:hypothetical protein